MYNADIVDVKIRDVETMTVHQRDYNILFTYYNITHMLS